MLENRNKPSKKSRRRFLKQAGAVTGVAVGTTVLAACGATATSAPAATTAPASNATTAPAATAAGSAATTAPAAAATSSSTKQYSGELRLLQWTHFVPAADEEFKRQADEWGKKNNVKVTVEIVASNDLQPKTTAAVEAKAGPDIIQMQYNWPHLYQTALVDVSKEASQLKSQLGGYYEFMEANTLVNGAHKAFPFAFASNAWVYRKSWLKEQGADKFPATWDEFRALGKKLKAAGHPMKQTMGQAYGDGTTMWYSFLWSYGGKEVEADGKTVAINSKETLAAVEAAVAIFNDCFDADVFAWDDSSNNKAFLAEQVSATLNGASVYLTAKKNNAPFVADIAHATNPKGPAGTALIHLSFNHGIMNWSKNQDAAKDLIMWLMQPEQHNKWLQAAGAYNVSSLRQYDNNPVFTADPVLLPYKEAAGLGRNPGWPASPSAAASEAQVKYIIVNMFAKAAQGKAPKDAITEAEAELNKIYKK